MMTLSVCMVTVCLWVALTSWKIGPERGLLVLGRMMLKQTVLAVSSRLMLLTSSVDPRKPTAGLKVQWEWCGGPLKSGLVSIPCVIAFVGPWH